MFTLIKQFLASARGSVSGWAHGGERSGQPSAAQCAQAAQGGQQPHGAQATQQPQSFQAAQGGQHPQGAQAAQAAQHPQTAQATQVEAGWRRRLWAHKKLSLRRMIVLTVVAVVFVLTGAIGCLSTWALEASLMDRAYIRVQAASQRVNTRRNS